MNQIDYDVQDAADYYSAEDAAWARFFIVFEVLSGEHSIADVTEKYGAAFSRFKEWSRRFLDGARYALKTGSDINDGRGEVSFLIDDLVGLRDRPDLMK